MANIIGKNYEVELVGLQSMESLWQPWSGIDVPIKSLKMTMAQQWFPGYFKVLKDTYKAIDGDVIYAVKTRFPSVFPAVLKKLFKGKPLIIDIDEWECSVFKSFNWADQSKKELLFYPESLLYTRLAEKMVGFADEITVVSTFLQKKYGRGTILIHGRNTDEFNPNLYNAQAIKKDLGWEKFHTMMYLGTPTYRSLAFKNILEAMRLLNIPNLRYIIVGVHTGSKIYKEMKNCTNGEFIFCEMIPFEKVPYYLSAADMVVLPYENIPMMRANIPAKIFDAMAMAKPIVTSAVSDIPEILKNCGLIARPGDSKDLANKIKWVLDHPKKAAEIGAKARQKCIKKYSWKAMERILGEVFQKYE